VIIKLVEIGSRECVKRWDEAGNRYVVEKSKEWIEGEVERLSMKDLFFLDRDNLTKDGYVTTEKLVGIMEYAAKFHGVNLILVDHLHYFLNLSQERNPTYKIDETMRALSQLCQRIKIHLLLVVHPHKIEDEKGKLVPVGLNSAKGSSSIQQESYNFFAVQRRQDGEKNFSRVKLLKNRAFGKTGEIEFDVLDNMTSFVEHIDVVAEQSEKEIPWWVK
jgi:hypothetical protein